MKFFTVLLFVFFACWPLEANDAAGSKRRYVVTRVDQLTQSPGERGVSAQSLASSLQVLGFQIVRELPLYGGVVIQADTMQISQLKMSKSLVISVSEEQILSIPSLKFEPISQSYLDGLGITQSLDWGVRRIGAFASSSRGEGIVVCVSDTGIDLNHPDLKKNIVANFSGIDPNQSGQDDNGHGTHVAGTIAAINNSLGVSGVAPKAKLIAAKGLNAQGSGFESDLAETIDGCVQRGAQVINMSWGSSQPSTIIQDALQRAADAGVVLVAAAGNSSTATRIAPVGYPAAFSTVIAVSATDSTDRIATFSNQGPEIAFAGPGVNILSTYVGGQYRALSGTSMATPHVVGAVALYLSKNPGATREQVKASLGASSTNLTANQEGRGLVSAFLSSR